MLTDALKPGRTSLFVPVLNRTASMGNFIGCHGGIAHEDNLVVWRILMKDVPGAGCLVHAPYIALPQTFINEVVKVEILHVLELHARSGEQLLTHPNVEIHGTTHIEKYQHLYRIMALRNHFQIQIPRVSGR